MTNRLYHIYASSYTLEETLFKLWFVIYENEKQHSERFQKKNNNDLHCTTQSIYLRRK